MSMTFVDALYSKYCDDGSLDIIELPQDDGHRRVCEYIRLEKVMKRLKNVSNLRWIDLSGHSIVEPCDAKFDRSQFSLPKTHFLDLTANKLTNWSTVCKILEWTPSLEELILSSNPILPPKTKDECEEIRKKFSKIKVIVMGDVGYSWQDFLECIQLWPNVINLNLFKNNIVELNNIENCLSELTFLTLSENPILDWKQICKLGKLKKLENLEMANCKINFLQFDIEDDLLFPNLKYLDLSNNQINDWRSVAELNKLPKLNTLLLKKNPLFDTNPYSHNFNFILGRIKNIVKLDREPVTKESRNDAEKYYLRMIYLEYLDRKNEPIENEKFLCENPCFLDLLEKFGEPVVAKKLTKQEMIKQNYLNLKIYDEHNTDMNKRIIQKQIPVTMKVSNLKFILRRLLKIDMNDDFSLIIKSNEYEETMEDRDDVLKYRFDSDAVIHVQRQ